MFVSLISHVLWLPFYWKVKIVFLLYLSLPQTQGSTYIYQTYLHPFLAKNEASLDLGYILPSKRTKKRTGSELVNNIIPAPEVSVTKSKSKTVTAQDSSLMDEHSVFEGNRNESRVQTVASDRNEADRPMAESASAERPAYDANEKLEHNLAAQECSQASNPDDRASEVHQEPGSAFQLPLPPASAVTKDFTATFVEIGTRDVSRKARAKARAEARARAFPNQRVIRPQAEITVYSSENWEREVIEVPLQIKHTAARRVILSSLANQPCSAFDGVEGLLEKLNEVLGTSYSLEAESKALKTLLQKYLDQKCDFGIVYGTLRPHWYIGGFADLQSRLDELERADRETREAAIDRAKGQIINSLLYPRRVWDLYSNRVLPWWVIKKDPSALSHSWMERHLQQSVLTPINAKEWPVPIPKDTTLERIRVELLNLDEEYVWLDVLCLRQKKEEDAEKGKGAEKENDADAERKRDAEREALRTEEWKLDVPTIGNVYHQNQKIIHYFSGLGRPFRLGNLDSERHWLNRAWTLQEISMNTVYAGINPDSEPIINPELDADGRYRDPSVGRFHATFGQLYVFSQDLDSIFPVLSAMRGRAATNELDKIAGLAYLLRCKILPQYDTSRTPDQAWSKLLEVMHERYRGDLFFGYPFPGSDGSGREWAPSWSQVLKTELPGAKGVYLYESIGLDEDGRYFHRGFCIEKAFISGIQTGDAATGRRLGTMAAKDEDGMEHTFQVFASHRCSIPEGTYTLIASNGYDCWVVGRRNSKGDIQKHSVLRLLEDEENKVESSILRKLGTMVVNFLV